MTGEPNILLLGNEANIAIALERLLSREGYEVLCVTDGTQALPNIRAQMPALVILDTTLPGRSGFDICQGLRLDPQFASIPVLMISGHATMAERRKGLAMGATAFLSKPFAMTDFIRLVATLMSGDAHEN